jgi:3-oxoacyl-(acyl-carrier-protein) synthase
MNDIHIIGWGAVSPAGHGIEALRTACRENAELPTTPIDHPGRTEPLKIRRVPAWSPRPSFLAHPRLRRSSAISLHAAAAAIEALGRNAAKIAQGELRLGMVFTTQTGCVSYSRRFYHEVLEDPSTASPIVFPETVFNAPASHIGTYLASNQINYTLVGDPGTFLQGMAIAAEWLIDGRVDLALVVGAEELDWIVCGAQHLLDRNIIVSEGAGALVLQRATETSEGVFLDRITEPVLFTSRAQRSVAARAIHEAITDQDHHTLLLDSLTGAPAVDRAETAAWAAWQGPRFSVKRLLGESYAAGSAWQSVLAADLLARGDHESAIVNVVGCNQQAIAARFVRA